MQTVTCIIVYCTVVGDITSDPSMHVYMHACCIHVTSLYVACMAWHGSWYDAVQADLWSHYCVCQHYSCVCVHVPLALLVCHAWRFKIVVDGVCAWDNMMTCQFSIPHEINNVFYSYVCLVQHAQSSE